MAVSADKSWHDPFAFGVNHDGIARNGNTGSSAHGKDFAPLDNHRTLFNGWLVDGQKRGIHPGYRTIGFCGLWVSTCGCLSGETWSAED
jgi:hypothetical protein